MPLDAVRPKTSVAPGVYAEFLDALADPAHENHADTKEWIGEDFDPNAVKFDELAGAVAKLAKAWARKLPTKRKLST